MKRIFTAFIALCLVLCLQAPFVFAKKEYTAPEYNGTRSEYVTREQAVACFIKAAGKEGLKANTKILEKFSDNNEISYAYMDSMALALECGLISGYEDGSLRPQSYVTRIEALVMLERALSDAQLGNWLDISFTDTPKWAEKQVKRLAVAGIVKGYGDGVLGAADMLTLSQVNMLCERIIRYTGPCGDFYNYVNSPWIENTDLNGEYYTSDIKQMNDLLAGRVGDIIYSLYRRHYNDGKQYDEDSDELRIINVYSAAANQVHRDKVGVTPLNNVLSVIDEISDKDTLTNAILELIKCGFSTFLPLKEDINLFDADTYAVSLSGFYDGVFSKTNTEIKNSEITDTECKDIYIEYIKTLFEISGDKDYAANAILAYEVCKSLSDDESDVELKSKSDDSKSSNRVNLNTDLNFSENINDKVKEWSAEKLNMEFLGIDTDKILTELCGGKIKSIIVYDEAATKKAAALCNADSAENIQAVKAYLKASVLDKMALYMTTENFNAYKKYQSRLSGAAYEDDNTIPSDYSIAITREIMGWEIGKLYVDMYFPKSIKEEVEKLTTEIIEEYKKLLNECIRLTPATRTLEIRKLKNIKVNAAFPDDFDNYINRDYEIRTIESGGCLPEYIMGKSKSEWSRLKTKLLSDIPPNRSEWIIYPYTANPVYDSVANSITIPAGVLCSPYFENGAKEEKNLGGIGFVIAHEISHAFDKRGSMFDEKGVLTLNKRWTQNDFIAFDKLCKETEREYSNISFCDTKVDGELTLNENIADISGMSCIISLAKKKGLDLDKVFRAYAESMKVKSTEEFDMFLLKNDVHSPSKVRVNRVLSNFDEFIDCYGVIEGDGMFIPKECRINILK